MLKGISNISLTILCCAVLLGSAPAVHAQAGDTAPSPLAHWVGKTPWGEPGGSFFDIPAVQQAMQRTLPKQTRERIAAWGRTAGEGNVIEAKDNLLTVKICNPKACKTDVMQIFYDEENDMLQALAVQNGKAQWHAPGSSSRSLPSVKNVGCVDWKCWESFFEKERIGWESHCYGANDDPDTFHTSYIPQLYTTVASFPPAHATAKLLGDTSLQSLKKYTNIKQYPAPHAFLEDPVLIRALDVLLGPDRRKSINYLFVGPASPSKIDDGILYFSACRQHACGMSFITIYVNMKENSVDVLWAEENSVLTTRKNFWLAAGKAPKAIGFLQNTDDMQLYRMYHK